MSTAIFSEKFTLETQLADSGLSETWIVRHNKTHEEFILIKIPADKRTRYLDNLLLFQKQVDYLADKEIPHIAKIIEFFEVEDHFCIVRQKLDGINLLQYLTEHPEIDTITFLKIAIPIAQTIGFLHSNNMIHGNLKPENIFLSEQDDKIEVTIADFGIHLVRDIHKAFQLRRSEIFSFMAPEQSGVLKRPIGPHTDLYTLGVIFYTILAGRPPFSHENIYSLLHMHIASHPQPISEYNEHVLPEIELIIQKLMQKDISSRYKNAESLSKELQHLYTELSRNKNKESVTPAMYEKTGDIRDVHSFVGRNEELNSLHHIYQNTLENRGALIVIEGNPGTGKSRLVEAFSEHVIYSGGLFVSSSFMEIETPLPYSSLTRCMHNFFKIIEMFPREIHSAVELSIQNTIGNLGFLFLPYIPELKEYVQSEPDIGQTDPQQARTLFEDTFERLLHAIAKHFPSIVFFIDNLQWADENTMRFLCKIAESKNLGNILFLAAMRPVENFTDNETVKYISKIKNFKTTQIISIDNLSKQEVAELISSMLGEETSVVTDLAEIVHTKTAGNALFVKEFILLLLREKNIIYEDGWKIHTDKIALLPVTENMTSVLLNTINHLSDEEQYVLSIAAVFGKEFEFHHIAECCTDIDIDTLFDVIETGKNNKILLSGQGSILFSHDLIHKMFYNQLNEEIRSRYHEILGAYYEKIFGNDPGAVYKILHHYNNSNNTKKSIEFSIKAGEFAQERNSHQDAVRFFSDAIKSLNEHPELKDFNQTNLHEKLGESLKHQGDYEASRKNFEMALSLVTDLQQRSELYKKLSYTEVAAGNYGEAIDTLTKALSLYGFTVPKSTPMLGMRLLGGLFKQFIHSRFPFFFIKQNPAEHNNPKYQRQILFQMIGWVCLWAIKQDLLIYSHFTALNYCDNAGISEEGLELLLTHCAVLGSIDGPPPMIRMFFKRIHKFLARIDHALHQLGNPPILQALYLAASGSITFNADAYEKAAAAMMILREKHTGTYLQEISNCAAQVYEVHGKFQDLLLLAEEVRNRGAMFTNKILVSIGDLFEGIAQYYLGNNDTAIKILEEAYHSFAAISDKVNGHYVRLFLLKAYARCGNYQKVEEYFNESVSIIKKEKQTHPVVIARIYPFFLEELLDRYIAFSGDEKERQRRLALAKTCYKKCRALEKSYTSHRILFFRISALYHWIVLHNARKARKIFTEGIQAASDSPQDYNKGMLHFRYGEFLMKRDPIESLNQLEKAYVILEKCQTSHELKIIERRIQEILELKNRIEDQNHKHSALGHESENSSSFTTTRELDTVIDISKKISFIDDIKVLMDEVLQHAIQFVGAEQGELFLLEGSRLVSKFHIALSGAQDIPSSPGVVSKADYLGQPLVISDARRDATFRNDPTVIKYGLKSILCVPLISRDKRIGILYLSNHHIAGLFTEHELDLLNAMAGQAAIAIENSLLFRETKRLQTHLTSIIDSLPGALIALDNNGRITYINNAAKLFFPELAKCNPGQLLWNAVSVLSKYKNSFDEVISAKSVVELPREVMSKHFMRITIFPLLDNEVRGAVIKVNDITEHEKIQQHLVQAQKMETVETLVGGLAHDFNNILGGILATISFLNQSILPSKSTFTKDDFEEEFSMITTLINRAISLVQQLLTISMRKEVHFTQVDVVESVKNVLKICRQSFDKSIKFNLDLPEFPAIINADIAQLEQVILNLCINASHAMTIMKRADEKWGGTLSVHIEKSVLDKPVGNRLVDVHQGEYWCLSIEDTGVGMSEEILKKIFEPFFTTKDTGKGTGLGLAMVYSIVRRFNGHINVYSEPDQGTMVHLYFPIKKPSANVQEKQCENRPLHHSDETILVIEDEVVIRKSVEKILESAGYTVFTAKDGKSGIACFSEHINNIDLVLLDMVMPGESGKYVFQKIMEIKPSTRVVLMSGFRKDQRVEDVIEMGASGFLQKPFNQDELFNVIRAVLAEESS
ncbi:MAG: response regulator [Spirochaetales bacterium]|nr:response regulator [Spirochaetales bacterium]